MGEALAWVGWIAEWLGKWIPRLEIVLTTHGAVKFRRGNEVLLLGPGLHFYWPLITEFRTYPVAIQTTDLRPQTLTLRDNKTVLIGGLITYEIEDLEKGLAHTWNLEETITDSALTAVSEVCPSYTWDELQELLRNGKLDIKLRAAARNALSAYGVKVLKMTVTDMALAKVYKLVQSTSAI